MAARVSDLTETVAITVSLKCEASTLLRHGANMRSRQRSSTMRYHSYRQDITLLELTPKARHIGHAALVHNSDAHDVLF